MTQGYSAIGPDDEPRLRDEHAFLSRQLGEVLQLAQVGDWQGCDTLWEVFSRELEHHLQYEEDLLFPAFTRTGKVGMLWTECFRADHGDLRAQCRALHREHVSRRIEALRRLAETLLAHQEQEASILCPWLATLSKPPRTWSVMRLTHSTGSETLRGSGSSQASPR